MTLPCLNQVLDGAGDVFDRHVGVDSVLVEEVDDIDLEPLERGVGDLSDVLGAAVEALPAGASVGIEIESELGGDDHLVAEGSEASPTSSSLVNGP